MRFEDFKTLIALHGSDPALWPDPGLAGRADVRDWLATEQAFEQALDAALADTTPELSANFADRVIAALPAETRKRSRLPAFGSIAALLCAAALGIGMLGLSSTDPTDLPYEAEWVSAAETAGMDDLYAWVTEG